MGSKIYKLKCPQLDIKKYTDFTMLEDDIVNKHICSKLNKRYSDALLLYLWEVKKADKKKKHYPKLTVTKSDKCPVCGMFLYKYPRWVARIVYHDKSLSFDGVKDMMKYYFKHKSNIKDILVQDYYTQKTINAKDAYFVIGSDVYGPMGNELIAFETKKSANRFALDHRATKVLPFAKITESEVLGLDE
jgi:nitrous oxide reductase accessory protein NosL